MKIFDNSRRIVTFYVTFGHNMKSAIVHDWIPVYGGAERVLSEIYNSFPSPIHTLMVDRSAIKNTPLENLEILPSLIQNLPFSRKKYRNYLPFFPYAIEQFNLSSFDLIISSSYAVAKGVIVYPEQLHICYCHSPARYVWDLYHHYLKEANLDKGLKGLIVKIILHYIRMWDITSLNRVDHFIANSKNVAKRIKRIYNRDAEVIYPPVDTESFKLGEHKEEFYLTASRMVPYKKIDIIVEAFSAMPDKKLIVIGDGPDFEKVKKKAKKNIELLGYQSFNVLVEYMKNAKGFVFAAEEDFGIVAVEAQACGTPVIGFAKGGLLETVVENKTGIFFKEQSTQAIVDSIRKFEKNINTFDPILIRKHSERFSKEVFSLNFNNFVNSKYNEFQSA